MNPLELMGNDNVSMEDLLEQITDPKTKMLAQMLIKQKSQQGSFSEDKRNSSGHGSIQRSKEDVKRLIRMNRELIVSLKSLNNEQERVKKLNKTVAEALGACECFGTDLDCEICHGNGEPGQFEINEAYFIKFVRPLFQKLLNQPDTKQSELTL